MKYLSFYLLIFLAACPICGCSANEKPLTERELYLGQIVALDPPTCEKLEARKAAYKDFEVCADHILRRQSDPNYKSEFDNMFDTICAHVINCEVFSRFPPEAIKIPNTKNGTTFECKPKETSKSCHKRFYEEAFNDGMVIRNWI
jgi:hypothetical protein